MLLPIFAVEALQYAHATPQLIGVAVGVYGLAQAGLQIPFGWLSDRYGRKPLILVGLGMIMLGSLIGWFATSIYGLICGRLLQGCGSIGSVVLATLSDHVDEKARSSAMAILGATIGVSFALALVLGPWLNQNLGFSGVFAVIAVLAGICSMLVAIVPGKLEAAGDAEGGASPSRAGTSTMGTPAAAGPAASIYSALNGQLRVLNCGIFVLHASLAALFLVIPILLQQAGVVANKLWQFYLLAIFAAMLVAWRVIKRGERAQNIDQVQILAIVGLLLAEVLLYTVNSWYGLLGSLILFFSAFCVLEASLPALVSKYATANNRGTAMGVYSCLQFLGVFVGGVVGGWLHSHFGTLAVLGFCVLLGAGWLVMNLSSLRRLIWRVA